MVQNHKISRDMSLAERPGICKKLQFLGAGSALSTWIQDARFKAEAPLDSTSLCWILNLESNVVWEGWVCSELQNMQLSDHKMH